QVVVGWGQALSVNRVVLVDDQVRNSEWEQELFRMGMPAGMGLEFASVAEAIVAAPEWVHSKLRIVIITGDVNSMVRLVRDSRAIKRVNLGGVHQQPGRRQRLPYVFLSDAEAEKLNRLAECGIEVTAQDVPTAKPVPMVELT
ncbi:MAG: PTS sugar transporter subunit IIB, partial [Gemmatimonadetes bacterium]|nr:PTS sugar transporter subunit IIB [Gemmatimonadota bacterium]